jgi:hypothetical protein
VLSYFTKKWFDLRLEPIFNTDPVALNDAAHLKSRKQSDSKICHLTLFTMNQSKSLIHTVEF